MLKDYNVCLDLCLHLHHGNIIPIEPDVNSIEFFKAPILH